MQWYKIYLAVTFNLILLYISRTSGTAPKSKTGPYRSTIVRSERCTNPSRPYEDVPTATFHIDIYNTTKRQNLMRGNATILRDNKNLKLKLKAYSMVNGNWQLSYMFNNVGCKGIMVTILVTLIGMKYDRVNCSAAKGSYTFENIDFNEIDHKWAKEREYGKLLWIAEAYSKAGTVACWETETEVTPV